jgi:excinuclease ABC subunit C
LRKRVSSYFTQSAREPRINAMIAQIAAIEITVTRTEAEALLLENQLIKSLRPRYNILLRDDKSYPYIFISSPAADAARIRFHRGPRREVGRYFGPYPGVLAVRETLNLVHKLFRLRQCEDSVYHHRTRPCLQHQIKRCSAPCVGLISAEDYRHDVRDAEWFLDGRSDALVDTYAERMHAAAERLDF